MKQDGHDTLRLFALASNGKSHSFGALAKSDRHLIDQSHDILSKQGFTGDELKDLILSPTELEEVPLATAEEARGAVASVDVLDPSSYPPVPKPANKDSFPPQKSPEILVSTHDIAVFLYFWGDKGESQGAYVPAVAEGLATNPPFPVPSKIAYKRYWMNTGSYQLIGPQHFSKAITTTQGMSKTKSTTLSAELGIEAKVLSAKLSATTGTSITITDETSVTETYSFDVQDGTTVVYTLWHLIEEFTLVDNANNPIEWSGRWGLGVAIFPAKFKDNVFANNSKRYVSDLVKFT